MDGVQRVDGEWVRVGEALAARMAELKLTKAEVIARSDISAKTLDRYLDGHPIKLANKERALAAALSWTTDSIDRILRGEPPVVVDTDSGSRDQLQVEIAELRNEIRALSDLVRRLDRS